MILTRGPGEYTYRTVEFFDDFEDRSASFDWTAHVRPASVFYSHIQSKHYNRMLECMQSGLGMHEESIAAVVDGVPILWLDMFCLRQCVNDWDLDKVGGLG